MCFNLGFLVLEFSKLQATLRVHISGEGVYSFYHLLSGVNVLYNLNHQNA